MSSDTEFWSSLHPLPTAATLKASNPATASITQFQRHARHQIEQILDGVDHRHLLIVGPCSIHHSTATLEYARKLRALSARVASSMMIVMRTYFEKPRTQMGWQGMLYDPKIDGSNDIAFGLKQARELLCKIAELELPTATEFLNTCAPQYLGDLISWGCIGARTVTSQPHRQIASALPMPVGFKNSVDGSITAAVQAITTAKEAHTFLGTNENGLPCAIESVGNPYSHLILRGGQLQTNYHADTVADAMQALLESGLSPRMIIDCSHDNCRKVAERQPAVFQEVIEQFIGGNQSIIGTMLESNLYSGKKADPTYGVSLTDPCIDWKTTEELILWAHNRLTNSQKTPCWVNQS